MRKIKLFTHNDLDGIGCAILANLFFIDLDIEYWDYIVISSCLFLYSGFHIFETILFKIQLSEIRLARLGKKFHGSFYYHYFCFSSLTFVVVPIAEAS
jgi:hypothetical protein